MNYLLKRSPDFSSKGLIIKKSDPYKEYSENSINKKPSCNTFKKGDRIFVSESSYGIYAHGVVKTIGLLEEFKSLEDILYHYSKSKSKDASYWLKMAEKLNAANMKKPSKLYYQTFVVDIKIYDKVRPLYGELGALAKRQNSITSITPEIVDLIDSYDTNSVMELNDKIPGYLRLNLYSLFNTKCSLSTWIDVDHFVPRSVGGPGNIPENLVPIGFSLNRYKSDSIPVGLFLVSNRYDKLKVFVKRDLTKSNNNFLRTGEAKEMARKITGVVNSWPIFEARKFYLEVLDHHHPEYSSIIKNDPLD